jgi:beta-phosphoglucomutase family hydrolase
VLGLPDRVTTCLFDLDGVLTDTASVHRKAWGDAFNPVLVSRDLRPFSDDDYEDFVDGKPRLDGVRDFLRSRQIELPEGNPSDSADDETVNGLATRKNNELQQRIARDGVTVYPGSRRYLEAAAGAGLHRIVVSSSANTAQVLEVTGLAQFIEGRIDGVTIEQQGIKGKPAPDSYLAGAALAGVSPEQAAVFEDAVAGVESGHRGKFGYVVGVNRLDAHHADELTAQGADVVVTDLGDLL